MIQREVDYGTMFTLIWWILTSVYSHSAPFVPCKLSSLREITLNDRIQRFQVINVSSRNLEMNLITIARQDILNWRVEQGASMQTVNLFRY